MDLYIAEKPELARAIASALGGGQNRKGYIDCGKDRVTWCYGHLLTLTDPEDHDPATKKWSLDQLPLRWPVEHKPIPNKKEQVSIIKGLAKQATAIVHAGDPDDEGQLLVDELLTFIGNKKPVTRVLINDLHPKIIRRALSNRRDNKEFHGLYQSALARSVSDQVYGYNLTRAYTLAGRASGGSAVLSVGRVQTPILGLVVRRDRSHEGHSSSHYWSITGNFHGEGKGFRAKYFPSDDAPVDEKGRIIDPAFAQQVVTDVEDENAEVARCLTKEKSTPPPLPYNLLTLQIDASRKFGLSPDDTLKVTQSLREKHKLITYNRSDCQYLSDEQHEDADNVLSAISKTARPLAKASINADRTINGRAFNSKNVSAHHGIIPTETVGDLTKLSENETRLYLIIARAYVAQFYPNYAFNETTVILDVNSHRFQAKSNVETNEGWKALYRNDKSDEDEPEEEAIPSLEWVSRISLIHCVDASAEQRKTKPPKRYTMATLLRDLSQVSKYVKDDRIKAILKAKDADKKGEQGGIGTPATRSAIIKQLIDRRFISEKGKAIISTDLGREFHDKLPESATTPDMTALWHEQQELIRSGVMTCAEFVTGVEQYVSSQIRSVKASVAEAPTNIKKPAEGSGIDCPSCGTGEIVKRKGKKGHFWGCNKYPGCEHTCQDDKGKPRITEADGQRAEVSKEKICPQCSQGMVKRESSRIKGTFWWGCSGFPKCRYNEPC